MPNSRPPVKWILPRNNAKSRSKEDLRLSRILRYERGGDRYEMTAVSVFPQMVGFGAAVVDKKKNSHQQHPPEIRYF
jgi:hypothetical protein